MNQFSLHLLESKSEQLSLCDDVLQKSEFIKIVTKGSCVEDIFQRLEKKEIDVLFLNFALSKKVILSFLEKFIKKDFSVKIVFVSPSESHDFEILHMAGLDYLFAPLDLIEVEYFLSKYINSNSDFSGQKKKLSHLANLLRVPGSIELPVSVDMGELSSINPSEVMCFTEDGDSTSIWFKSGVRKTIHKSLYKLEPYLPVHFFLRINNHTVINKYFIERLDKKNNSCYVSCKGKTFDLKFSDKVLQKLNALVESNRYSEYNYSS